MRDVNVHYVQEVDGYDEPEFFESGVVAIISSSERIIEVHREGEASLALNGPQELVWIECPDDFRAYFRQTRSIHDDWVVEWKFNGWFDLYDGSTGEHLDYVSHSLARITLAAQRAVAQNNVVS